MTTETPTARFAVCMIPSCRAPDQLEIETFDDPAELLRALFEAAKDPELRAAKDGRGLIAFRPAPPLEGGFYLGELLEDGNREQVSKPYRLEQNFSEASALILDFDGATVDGLAAALVKLRERGIGFVAWPTHSYGTTDKPFRYRLAFGLSKPVPTSTWEASWPVLVTHLELDTFKGIDRACSDVGRIMYLTSWDPTNPTPRPAPELNEGAPIDVGAVLSAVTKNAAERAPVPYVRFEDGTTAASPEDVWQRMERVCTTTEDQALLKAAKAGEVLSIDGGRHPAYRRITSKLAFIARAEESTESLLDVIAPSLEALAHLEPGRKVRADVLRALKGARQKHAQREAEQAASHAQLLTKLRALLPASANQEPTRPMSEWPVMKLYTSSTCFLRKWNGPGMDLTKALTARQADDHLMATLGTRVGLGEELEIEGICFSVRELGSFPGQPAIVDLAPDCRAYNTWVPPALTPAAGEWPRVRRVLSWLVDHDPEGLEWLLNWIAFKVQKPAEMPCTAILLQGPQGTGKNILFRVLARILGEENCAQIGERDVGKEFNSHYATALLVFVNELAKHGARDIDLGNAFKAQITDKRDWIEGKGKDRIYFDNRKAFIAATNHAKPIILESEDRRWSIFHNRTPATSRLADGTTHREFLAGLHVEGVNEKFTEDFEREISAFAFDMLKRQVDARQVRTPFENAARKSLKELGEEFPERFVRELSEFHSDAAREKRIEDLAASQGVNRHEVKLSGRQAFSRKALHAAFRGFCEELGVGRNHIPGPDPLTTALQGAGWIKRHFELGNAWVPPWARAAGGAS